MTDDEVKLMFFKILFLLCFYTYLLSYFPPPDHPPQMCQLSLLVRACLIVTMQIDLRLCLNLRHFDNFNCLKRHSLNFGKRSCCLGKPKMTATVVF